MKPAICPLPDVAVNAAKQEGERKQAGSVQHKFWSIKSVKRELCKSENTCVHRLVHVA